MAARQNGIRVGGRCKMGWLRPELLPPPASPPAQRAGWLHVVARHVCNVVCVGSGGDGGGGGGGSSGAVGTVVQQPLTSSLLRAHKAASCCGRAEGMQPLPWAM
uniref:Uncharacterized protein n=1 Tax=Chlamydomonas leiostraca TaxID=1034604 RepID=A0A7S0N8K9_9CHLO|mmetsp:Transcript_10993/g.27029  ORF Transcript_10993/g.27029 Transcript_10993/m.27029 type:complete len:104 (+) Transcript_10993:31-342(+)